MSTVARSYDSQVRGEQAASTRRRILTTAKQLLLADGYPAMTVAKLARAAGVSPQTVYNAVGGKATVVKAVYDVSLAGDDEPVPMNERPEFKAVIAASSAEECLRRYAYLSRVIYERVGPLLGVLGVHGSAGDAELENFRRTIDGERRIGNTGVITHLDRQFGLPPEWTREQAIDMTWALTAPEPLTRLRQDCGWSLDDCERWLGDCLVSLLVV